MKNERKPKIIVGAFMALAVITWIVCNMEQVWAVDTEETGEVVETEVTPEPTATPTATATPTPEPTPTPTATPTPEPTAEPTPTPEVKAEDKEPVQPTDNPNVTTKTEAEKQAELHNDFQSRLAAIDAEFGITGDTPVVSGITDEDYVGSGTHFGDLQ